MFTLLQEEKKAEDLKLMNLSGLGKRLKEKEIKGDPFNFCIRCFNNYLVMEKKG
jgi:hypothetical protein